MKRIIVSALFIYYCCCCGFCIPVVDETEGRDAAGNRDGKLFCEITRLGEIPETTEPIGAIQPVMPAEGTTASTEQPVVPVEGSPESTDVSTGEITIPIDFKHRSNQSGDPCYRDRNNNQK